MELNQVTEEDFLKKYNHLLPPRDLSPQEVEHLKDWSKRGWWSSGPRKQSYCSPLFKCKYCSNKSKKQKCQMTRPTQPYKISTPTGNGMVYKGVEYRIGDTVEIKGEHDEIWIGVIRQYYPFAEQLNVLWFWNANHVHCKTKLEQKELTLSKNGDDVTIQTLLRKCRVIHSSEIEDRKAYLQQPHHYFFTHCYDEVKNKLLNSFQDKKLNNKKRARVDESEMIHKMLQPLPPPISPDKEIDKEIDEEEDDIVIEEPDFNPIDSNITMEQQSITRIALKIVHIASKYLEFGSVEKHLFAALKKLNLIDERDNCNYSMCGKTQESVPAIERVVSLNLNGVVREHDFTSIINSELPEDIRVIACASVPLEFSADADESIEWSFNDEAKQMIDQQTSAENQSQIHTESSQQSAEQNSNAQTVSLLDSLLTDSSITQDALDSIEKDEIHNNLIRILDAVMDTPINTMNTNIESTSLLTDTNINSISSSTPTDVNINSTSSPSVPQQPLVYFNPYPFIPYPQIPQQLPHQQPPIPQQLQQLPHQQQPQIQHQPKPDPQPQHQLQHSVQQPQQVEFQQLYLQQLHQHSQHQQLQELYRPAIQTPQQLDPQHQQLHPQQLHQHSLQQQDPQQQHPQTIQTPTQHDQQPQQQPNVTTGGYYPYQMYYPYDYPPYHFPYPHPYLYPYAYYGYPNMVTSQPASTPSSSTTQTVSQSPTSLPSSTAVTISPYNLTVPPSPTPLTSTATLALPPSPTPRPSSTTLSIPQSPTALPSTNMTVPSSPLNAPVSSPQTPQLHVKQEEPNSVWKLLSSLGMTVYWDRLQHYTTLKKLSNLPLRDATALNIPLGDLIRIVDAAKTQSQS